MRVLFLMASLRAGSHMVRSMLREEPSILDDRGEHEPIVPTERAVIYGGDRTVLVPLKYGYGGSLSDCLAANEFQEACALILHRRDWRAQAESLAFAKRNKAWVTAPAKPLQAPVDDWEKAELRATKTAVALDTLTAGLSIPHEVLAYEDISVATVSAALETLLGGPVNVVEPATEKVRA